MKSQALGVFCSENKTVFSVWCPYASVVKLNIYKTSTDALPIISTEMTADKKLFTKELPVNFAGKYYTYVVDGKETIDPYARSAGPNGKRGMVVPPDTYSPEGWDKDTFTAKPPIIWEVHVRDLTSDTYLEFPTRGKYIGFAQGVKTPKGKTALVDYLRELGVTYVHLLPIGDFASVDETNPVNFNWGYDPQNYNVPEGSYATDPYDGRVRIVEFKRLVQALHKAGIGVIMDVVYNHTYSVKDNALNICAPDYCYRKEGRNYRNGSGCGNETASEKEMFRRFMVESVCWWAKEYHIDGFRFDLMGLHDVDTMNTIRLALDNLYEDGHGKDILMYGEPWSCKTPTGIVPADKDNVKKLSPRIAIFNDTFRDGIRGKDFFTDEPGYIQGVIASAKAVESGIEGSTHGKKYASDFVEVACPTQQISYTNCHDGYTLRDYLTVTMPKASEALLQERHRMAAFIPMFSLGIPFILSGDEFMRTKKGEKNSYNLPDDINKLDWKLREDNDEMVQFFANLISLRKLNHVFDDLATAESKFEWLSRGETLAWRVGEYAYCVNVGKNGYVWQVNGTVLCEGAQIDLDGIKQVESITVPCGGICAVKLA